MNYINHDPTVRALAESFGEQPHDYARLEFAVHELRNAIMPARVALAQLVSNPDAPEAAARADRVLAGLDRCERLANIMAEYLRATPPVPK